MRQTHAAAALAASVIVAPVTLPAGTDIENVPMDVALVVAVWRPPVMPSKHVAVCACTAAAPPGQPQQKTPNAKRVTTDSSDDEIEDESDDVLPALGAALSII